MQKFQGLINFKKDPFENDVLEKMFRLIWTNNANALSHLYTCSNAMKTDITKFGKRTFSGQMNDLKAVFKRYFWNNFLEYERHDLL